MGRLPADVCMKIFGSLDHQNLATAQQVCRRWKVLASDNILWSNLFEERWGRDQAAFYAPVGLKSWKVLASDNILWSNLFEERWGRDQAAFYAPVGLKSWKDMYEVQDRCDRVGLGLKIIREGGDYYLIHQGEIQCHLGSRRQQKGPNGCLLSSETDFVGGEGSLKEEPSLGILDKILFFLGDLESASSVCAKRSRKV